jgi:4-amino-4-deoxy-L-arabinose transferase-like glycosyltransferase
MPRLFPIAAFRTESEAPFLWSYPAMILLLAAAIVPRLLWIAAFRWAPFSDAAWYHQAAIDLAHGFGYRAGELPTAYFPIGYPAFLAGLFLLFPATQLTVALAQTVLGAGLVVASLAMFRELGLSPFLARLAALLVALCPTITFYVTLEMVETLVTFLLVVGTYLLLVSRRAPWAALAAGVVFGAATLVRSQVLLLPVLMIGLLFVQHGDWRRSARIAVLTYVALACVVSPWTIRNWRVLGIAALVSTNDGANLLLGNNPAQRWGGGYPITPALALDLEGVSYTDLRSPADEAAWDRRVRARAWAYIAADPMHYVLVAPRKLQRHFGVDRQIIDQNDRQARLAGDDIGWILPVVSPINTAFHELLVAVCLLALGAAAVRRDLRGPILLGLLPAAYFAAISMVFFAEPRFNFPALPFMIGAAVTGAAAAFQSRFGLRGVPASAPPPLVEKPAPGAAKSL